MQPKLVRLVDQTMPKFNRTLTEGFHLKEFQNIEKYYENILKMTLKSLEKRGFYFRGVEPLRPEEMLAIVNNSQYRTFETHKETIFPVKMKFEYVNPTTGEVVELKDGVTYLPFTDRYGDIWIKGTQYSLQMVLADRGLSVTKENMIFVKVLGFKFKIGAENYTFDKVNNEVSNHYSISPFSMNLPMNRFYAANKSREVDPKRTPTPLLAWYVFAEHGFEKAMELYSECEYAIGDTDYIIENYLYKDGWQIYNCNSRKSNKMITEYIDLNYSVAIRPKSQKRNGELPTIAMQYVAALLMAIGVAPARFDLRKINRIDFWRLLIGRCSVKSDEPDEVIMRYMGEHFDSMADYLDEASIRRFASQSIDVKDMFELFNYIIINRTDIIRKTDKATLINKCLSSVEFALDNLIIAANQFKHEIKNTAGLNKKRFNTLISSHFKLREIEQANKDANLIQEPTPTDNPFADYGLGVLPQSKVYNAKNSKGKRSNNKFNINDPSVATHTSVAFACSYQRITKPAPDGRGFIAPCVSLIDGKIITVAPELRELYKETDDRLTRRQIRNKVKDGDNANEPDE